MVTRQPKTVSGLRISSASFLWTVTSKRPSRSTVSVVVCVFSAADPRLCSSASGLVVEIEFLVGHFFYLRERTRHVRRVKKIENTKVSAKNPSAAVAGRRSQERELFSGLIHCD